MSEYYVIKKSDCETCKGYGMVTHPKWIEFMDEFKDRPQDEDEIEEWFHKEGFDYPPDEEIECAECEGTGESTTQVELSIALSNLLDKQR